MNLLAFVLAVVCGVIGAIEVGKSSWKSTTGWALVAISLSVIFQDVFIHWSHTVHA